MSRENISKLATNLLKFCHYLILRIFGNRRTRDSIIPLNNIEEVIIIGNGPSLNKINFDCISRDKYTFFCMNRFPLSSTPLFLKIKPKYYSAFDDVSYGASKLKTNMQDITEINDDYSKIFQILNSITWDMTYICFPHQNPPINNPHIKIIHINEWQYTGKYSRYTLYSKNKATFGYGNSLLAALYFTITQKVNSIYLIGFDFSLYVKHYIDESNNICQDDEHYYGKKKLIINGNDKRFQKGDYYKIIEEYAEVLRNLNYAKEYATHNNVKIYNTTPNSYIDSFDKIPIEKIYN